jgi:hypothetical protein
VALKAGDKIGDFTLAAAIDDKVSEVTLDQLLNGHHGLVIHTYALDFTGG